MKPILFSTLMVQAILAGQKTMTRRVIKPQPPNEAKECLGICTDSTDKTHIGRIIFGEEFRVDSYAKVPYLTGDILWLRETWRVGAWDHKLGAICVDYAADGYADPTWKHLEKVGFFDRLSRQSSEDAYAAGVIDENGQCRWERGKGPTRWRPSIFMPKETARIFLRVIHVRAERLQDISEDDAISEGMLSYDGWETPEYIKARNEAHASGTKPPLGYSPR